MIHLEQGKKWNLPDVVSFESAVNVDKVVKLRQSISGFPPMMFYRVVAYLEPKAGEWYLSGSTVKAYRSKHGLPGTKYLIVLPTAQARMKTYKNWEPVKVN